MTYSSRRQLAKQIRFLKVEIAILRSKVKVRVSLTQHLRATLIRFGQELGNNIVNKLVSIVRPSSQPSKHQSTMSSSSI